MHETFTPQGDDPPDGYLGAEARIRRGPAPELVASGYALELSDAPLLHRGLTVADLAHVVGLHEAGVIPAGPAATLADALLALLATDPEDFPYDPVYGDAYNSRERELERRIGDTAGWLHTGRTRREAGRIAFRLSLLDRLLGLHDAVCRFTEAVLRRAEEHANTLWNDVTYLQPAQPSTFGHYLLSFAEEASRHLERVQAAHRWADTSPGGVGGVGGTRIPLDRRLLADLLGLSVVGGHTRDSMWATDGVVDAVVAASQATTTVDRLAEDLEVFTTPEFNYVTLDASLCRASVQMPQKRNPYALPVIRGGASSLLGRVTAVMATQRTPSARTDNWLHTYGECATALTVATRLVALGSAVVETLDIHTDVLRAGAGAHFSCATDLTDTLVLSGQMDYRSAYRRVGRAVAGAIEQGRSSMVPGDVLEGLDIAVDPSEVAVALDPEQVVATRVADGGSAPARVHERVADLHAVVGRARTWASTRRGVQEAAEARLLHRARCLASGGA